MSELTCMIVLSKAKKTHFPNSIELFQQV